MSKKQKRTTASVANAGNPRKDYLQFKNGRETISMVRRDTVVGIKQLVDDAVILGEDEIRCRIYCVMGDQRFEFESTEEYQKLRARLYNEFFSGI